MSPVEHNRDLVRIPRPRPARCVAPPSPRVSSAPEPCRAFAPPELGSSPGYPASPAAPPGSHEPEQLDPVGGEHPGSRARTGRGSATRARSGSPDSLRIPAATPLREESLCSGSRRAEPGPFVGRAPSGRPRATLMLCTLPPAVPPSGCRSRSRRVGDVSSPPPAPAWCGAEYGGGRRPLPDGSSRTNGSSTRRLHTPPAPRGNRHRLGTQARRAGGEDARAIGASVGVNDTVTRSPATRDRCCVSSRVCRWPPPTRTGSSSPSLRSRAEGMAARPAPEAPLAATITASGSTRLRGEGGCDARVTAVGWRPGTATPGRALQLFSRPGAAAVRKARCRRGPARRTGASRRGRAAESPRRSPRSACSAPTATGERSTGCAAGPGTPRRVRRATRPRSPQYPVGERGQVGLTSPSVRPALLCAASRADLHAGVCGQETQDLPSW